MKIKGFFAILLVLSGLQLATAGDQKKYEITIKDHKFHPAEITIPANTKVTLVVHNKDKTAEEFESHSMHREKVIGPGKTAYIKIGPLKPGTYKFEGEFHPKTAQGRVIVK